MIKKIIYPILLFSVLLARNIQAEGLERNEPIQSKVKSANIMIGNFDMPVGAVIGFVSSTPGVELPKGFKLCNGPQVEDDPNTTFDERKIPSLNPPGTEHRNDFLWIIKVH
ncbi:MAG: hypothetical protein Q8R88_17885 [Desulfoprunum sp.]|nr:hypothetical protein [Desulfoprunum sp.]